MSGRSRERDEARRERDEQVALRDEEREAANAAFKAADAERETHLATIRNKDREIASLKARLRGAAVSDENVEFEVEEPAAKRKEAATNAAQKPRPTKRTKTADAEVRARLEALYVGGVFNDASDGRARKVVRIEKAGSDWTAVAALLDNVNDEAPYPANEALDSMIRAFVPPRPKQMASGDEVPPPPRQSPRRASAAPAPALAIAPAPTPAPANDDDEEPKPRPKPKPKRKRRKRDVLSDSSDDGAPPPQQPPPRRRAPKKAPKDVRRKRDVLSDSSDDEDPPSSSPPPRRRAPKKAPMDVDEAAPIDVDVESQSAPAGRSPRSEPPPPGDQSMDVEPPAAAAPMPAPSETPIDVEALDSDDGAPAPAAAEPAVAFTGPDLTDAERHMVEFVLRREPKDVISMKTLRREVEALLGAPEDALKVKKGAIKAFLRTECVPRVLETMPRIVDDEDDD